MSITPTANSAHLGNTSMQTAPTPTQTLTTLGLSSVEDSLSSLPAESGGFFGGILAKFTAGWNALKAFFAPFFFTQEKKVSPDEERCAHIKDRLDGINTVSYEECLDKFFHIQNPVHKLEAFKAIQNSTQASAQTVRAFYGHLAVDVQGHIKRHTWEANGNRDDGMGLAYGDFTLYWHPKHAHVSTAIDKCIAEAKAGS